MQKMQELDQTGRYQGPVLNGQMSNNQNVCVRGGLSGEPQAALAMTNYQNLLMRHNSMNSTINSTQQEGSSPYGSSGTLSGILRNSPINGFSGCQVPQQQQQQSPNGNGLLIQQSQSLPPQNNQTLHQQMVQQYLQEMSRKNNGEVVLQQQALPKQNASGSTSVSGLGIRNTGDGPSEAIRFKAGASSMSESTAAMGFGQKVSDLTHSLHSSDGMVADIAHELIENGFFGSDLDDIDFNWK